MRRFSWTHVRICFSTPPVFHLALAVLLIACGILTGCSKDDPSNDIDLTTVAFPDGTKIVAETLRTDFERVRGMMFRASLPADHGMLFVHPKEDKYTYWTYQTKIPLDMIWMDHDHRIVEIAPNAQPCTTKASECPKFGGHFQANFVLEVNAGVAAKNHLREGDSLDF
jgi:uncharacterized membrane protein (UPF0127 family)